ncbi:MAG: preprotein translocase subunit SecA [Mariniblastus sp.]|nr:preprotein translocase subunit SecA [Mariniblastus sp.]
MNLPAFLNAVKEQAKVSRTLDDASLRDAALELSYEAKQNDKQTELFVIKAFAVVQAAAERHLQMSHYPVQLQGGRAMCRGHIAEMRTGEGKTLTATLPLFVHALKGRGVLLATANDYLAKRDAQWMMPVYEALGLSTGVIQSEMSRPQRRNAYSCDITYGTMKEFGFDFLRDHSSQRQMKQDQLYFGSHPSGAAQPPGDQLPVHRKPHFLLIDEADSILIDDARTPLIISSAEDDMTQDQQQMLYQWSAESVPNFEEDIEYWYDKEQKRVDLTPEGTARVREVAKPKILDGVGLPEMYDFVERAIQVDRDYKCNRDYVVRDGEIVIVDEATGRISEGRRWSRGIHQAIEAKENVTITMDTNTSAKITVQSFVSRYPLIAGMTGTAASAAREFKKIYHAPVSVIPPNKPSQKTELPVTFRPTEEKKWQAVVDEIKEIHATQRPLLVGTRSIAKSEILSGLLHQAGVSHAVLNARQIEREADIIAQAGEPGRVTVATNMAGRGTDIKIDDRVKSLGGLHVICTEMHDSARIDLQLFGRCGRQGDPGSFRQYVSAEDQLLDSAFGRPTAKRYRKIGKIRSDRWWIQLFRKAQKKLENQHYRARKILMYNEKQLAKSHIEMGLDPILDVYD